MKFNVTIKRIALNIRSASSLKLASLGAIVLIILFSYITWIVSILLLYAFPSMLLDIYFNYKINNAYLNYYSFLMYYNLDINYYLYLFSLSCFTVFLFFINYFLIYGKKEKVVLQNEKEMV